MFLVFRVKRVFETTTTDHASFFGRNTHTTLTLSHPDRIPLGTLLCRKIASPQQEPSEVDSETCEPYRNRWVAIIVAVLDGNWRCAP